MATCFPVQGFRLPARRYVPIVPDREGALAGVPLGLSMVLEDGRLRFVERETGRPWLRMAEVAQAQREAEAKAAKAEAKAKAAATKGEARCGKGHAQA
jgi:hypothetical protein